MLKIDEFYIFLFIVLKFFNGKSKYKWIIFMSDHILNHDRPSIMCRFVNIWKKCNRGMVVNKRYISYD
jgi:hypothetical protein